MLTFVDTGVWYASVVPTDPRHAPVVGWLRANVAQLVTTDYVIDETLTLLRARGHKTRAIQIGRQFFDLDAVAIHYVDDADLRSAWDTFKQNPDREWSFTDCTSKAVLDRLHIKQALTFDHHFHEFGAIRIVP